MSADPAATVTALIDGRPVACAPGSSIREAAAAIGIDIPGLCWFEGLPVQNTCWLCLVEVDGRADLVPSCASRLEPGMVVRTDSERIATARRTCLELLLSDHAGSCVGPCTDGCPAGMEIAAFLDEVERGDRRAALAIARRALPLPAALGRLCNAFCESACLRKNVDEPLSIRSLHGLLAEVDLASGDPYVPPCRPATGRRIAIVGAGPAGLAAAHRLLELGHACTVYDAEELAGGLLRGAHAGAVEPELVDAEVGLIQRMGMELRTGWRLGRDGTVDELAAAHDAVVLALGATRAWTTEGRKVDLELVRALGLDATAKGISANRDTGATSRPGVYAAGEAVSGAGNVIRSIASAQRAAEAIDRQLSGRDAGRRRPWFFKSKLTERESRHRYGRDKAPRPEHAVIAAALADGVGASARVEAARCLDCACPALHTCRLRIHSAACDADPAAYAGPRRELDVDTSHPDVLFEPGKCILCGLCLAVAEQAGDHLGLALTGRGFGTRVGVPFADAVRAGIAGSARRCAEVCPSGAIVLSPRAPTRSESP